MIQSGFSTLNWQPGDVSRPTLKGYRRPAGFAIPVVFKPATKPATKVGTVTRIKGK
jgi:hypothetical protein